MSDPELERLLGLEEPEEEKPTPFAERVHSVLAMALVELRKIGMVEVEEEHLPQLTTEVVEAVLESSSARKLPLRIAKTLIHSEHVEEVYGTDVEITTALEPFLEQL